MSPDAGTQHQQQKDIIQTFFQFNSTRDTTDRFDNRFAGPQAPGNFSSQPPMSNMHFGSDVFQHMIPSMDGSGQAGSSSSQPTHQALLEQQFRLTQLQQLQQLQNQIFQQQLELLSGQNAFAVAQGLTDRQREQQQYGLPTPAQSGELRAQPSPDFVSPMLLHSGAALGNLTHPPSNIPPQVTNMQDFLSQSQQMIPSAPHSAPANIAFQISPQLSMPSGSSGADLDFSDISPLTSPWLGAYSNTQGVSGSSANTVGQKRRGASSSGDEAVSVQRPSRKRQSSIRAPPRPGTSLQKRASMRGTRSANSTPLFNGMARPDMGMDMPHMNDLVGDSPSPIELPPMPPPAHPSQSLEQEPTSPTSANPTASVMSASPASNSLPAITPVTPSSIMNLGRLGINNSLVPHDSRAHKTDGSGKARTSSKSNSFVEPRTTRSADKATTIPLLSPGQKPLRPAGNSPVVTTSQSPTTAQPIVQFRKSSHKAAEQKRRDSLKTSFDDLRILLPPIPLPSEDGYPDEPVLPGAMPPRGPPKGNAEGPNRGVSKLQLLRCGNEYIKVLKGRVERRDAEIEKLRREIARLRVVAGPEAAMADDDEEIDLDFDLDALEGSGATGLLLGRGHSRDPSLGDVDEVDEGGAES